jgi:tRNA dimethylallyltransferase
MKKTKILIILGPTATGKTDLGIRLAKIVNGEIISCDSRQVYRGLDIGTGKLPSNYESLKKENNFWKIDGVKTWQLDVADPRKRYSVFDNLLDTKKIINQLIQEGKLPIIVGGTGLYIKALIEGLDQEIIDNDLRTTLEKKSLEELQEDLKRNSLKSWEELTEPDKKNKRRLTRALEKIKNPNGKKEEGLRDNFDILIIGINNWPNC